MRAQIAQSSLLSMAAKAARVVSKDSHDPTYGAVLLTACDDKLLVTSSDGIRWVRCVSPANVEEPGFTAVSAQKLLKFARGVPDMAVEVESVGAAVKVRCGKAKADLLVTDAEGLAAFPEPAVEKSVTVRSDAILEMAKAASKMDMKDASKPVQQGLHLVASEGTVRMEACGLSTAAVCETECGAGSIDVVVPPNAFADALSGDDGEVIVGVGARTLSIWTERSTYVTRTIEGVFPNMGVLLQGDTVCSVVVDAADLMAALDLLSAIDTVSVRFHATGGELTMSADTKMDGLVETVVEANVSGEIDIYLNPRNVRNAAAMGRELEFLFRGAMQPAIARSDRFGWTCVMMPMRRYR